MGSPKIPERQQVQPGAEPQLADREMLPPRPCPGEAASAKEYGAFLAEPLAGKIDIAMGPREWGGPFRCKRPKLKVGQGRQPRHQSLGRVAATM